jgi:hypothetical protein
LCTEKLITWINPNINHTESLSLPSVGPEDIVRLLAGLIEGLVQEDHLDEIGQCIKDTVTIERTLSIAIADFEKGDVADIIQGVKLVGTVLQALPNDLADCEGMGDDIARIEKWAQIFEHP